MSERILLKSRDATYTSSTVRESYRWSLPNALLDGEYKVAAATLSYGFYNVSSVNNIVYTSLGNATLTNGYYTAATFTTMLQTQLQVANINFTATYNTDTKKITITNTGAFTLNFGSNDYATACYLLGYEATNSASATSQVATYPVNLLVAPAVILDFEGSGGSQIQTGNIRTDVRGTVYLPFNNVSYGAYVSFLHKDLPQTLQFNNKKDVIMNVWDTNGNPLSLNRSDIEILLERVDSKCCKK